MTQNLTVPSRPARAAKPREIREGPFREDILDLLRPDGVLKSVAELMAEDARGLD